MILMIVKLRKGDQEGNFVFNLILRRCIINGRQVVKRRKILVHSEFEDESSSNDSSNDETDYDSDTDSDYDE